MQINAISTPMVCSPRLETSHATGLQCFPESLGIADHTRTSPMGHNSQTKPRGPSRSPSRAGTASWGGVCRWAAATAKGNTTQP